MSGQFKVKKELKRQVDKARDCEIGKDNGFVFHEEFDDKWMPAAKEDESSIESCLPGDIINDKEKNFHAEYKQPFSTINWNKAQDLFTNDEIITLKVTGYNRGGLLVEGEYIHGFVPFSHLVDLPSNAIKKKRELLFPTYLNREIALKVIECDPIKDRIVFSQRAALAGAGKRKKLLSNLAVGDIVSGFVSNVTNFGVFVDLGGLEGLIHISELSWGRVHHPATILNIGDEIETMVISVLEEQARVALSLKRLEKNPWDNLVGRLSPGDILDAVITRIVKYGAFACLEIGIEGLIHISTIVFPEKCTSIGDFLFEGQAVKVIVINVDAHKRRLGLKLEGC